MKLCFATNNAHKIREVQDLLPPTIKLLSLNEIGCDDELPETSNTIEANSLQKATYVFENYGLECFADDTGLEVASLNGEPGVYSARYAGIPPSAERNVEKLLSEMNVVTNRAARFRTVITLLLTSEVHIFEGIMNGKIAEESRGTNGFGYDPVFVPEGYTITFAEMSSQMKNSISHRAIATRKLIDFLSKK